MKIKKNSSTKIKEDKKEKEYFKYSELSPLKKNKAYQNVSDMLISDVLAGCEILLDYKRGWALTIPAIIYHEDKYNTENLILADIIEDICVVKDYKGKKGFNLWLNSKYPNLFILPEKRDLIQMINSSDFKITQRVINDFANKKIFIEQGNDKLVLGLKKKVIPYNKKEMEFIELFIQKFNDSLVDTGILWYQKMIEKIKDNEKDIIEKLLRYPEFLYSEDGYLVFNKNGDVVSSSGGIINTDNSNSPFFNVKISFE